MLGDTSQLFTGPQELGQLNDVQNNIRAATQANGEGWWWWLRSPGESNYKAAHVRIIGAVRIIGEYINYSPGGIRPAMWVSIN